MPSMRRELDVWHGRRQPLAWPPAAHYIARNLRNFNFELPAVRRELACYDSHDGISGAGRRRIFGVDESWRNQRPGAATTWCVSAVAFRFVPALAVNHGHVSSRQFSAHWL